MAFRALAGIVALVALCAATPARAQDCALKQVTSIDLFAPDAARPMVPVKVNDVPKLFLLDTGGYTSQLTPDTVRDLKLVLHDTTTRLYDVSGHVSSHFVVTDTFTLGTMTGKGLRFMVAPDNMGIADGILSSDLLFRYDIDMDFGAGKLNYFSQDHCPGKVVYWTAPDIAEVPLTVRDQSHLLVEVQLDGKPFDALVDTGATRSSISMPVARGTFGLGPDSPGVTLAGNVNGDPKLSSYSHTFSTLTFEGVTVSNPKMLIVPDRMGGTEPQTASHIPGNPDVHLPQLILGMDIMRHLHMYMSFKEGRMYVSAASPPPPQTFAAGQSRRLSELDQAITYSPANAVLRNSRCFQRGIEKVKLDEALIDCELSLKARPDDPRILDSKAFVLYQSERYQEARDMYDAALAIAPRQASSLFMRGQAREKLGDAAGAQADIAAAKALDPDVAAVFRMAP